MHRAVPSHGEVQQALADVLARPEFADRPVSGIIALLARLRERVVEALLAALERLVSNAGGGAALAMAVQLVLAVAALSIAGFLLLRLLRSRRYSGRVATATTGPPAGDHTPVDWLAAAELASRQGRYREATLALYRSLLDRLDRDGLIRVDPAKTSGDYRHELRRAGPASAFVAFCRVFEPTAFGKAEPDRAAYERVSAAAEAV